MEWTSASTPVKLSRISFTRFFSISWRQQSYAVLLALAIAACFSDARDVVENYQVMFTGIEHAVNSHGDQMDLTRVGFMGHSYSGGAVPWLAREFVVLRGSGSAGNTPLITKDSSLYSSPFTDPRNPRL